jgi:hypothetical protein
VSTTTGTIVRVRRDPAGDGLAADAAIGATSLVLDWAIDFDPEGGTLQIGAEVIAYTAVNDDTDTVTLAAATTVAYEAGTPVAALDETGKQAETWTIDVDLNDGGQPVPAGAVHSLLNLLREDDELAGTQVEVERTDGGLIVRSILDKAPAISARTFRTSYPDGSKAWAFGSLTETATGNEVDGLGPQVGAALLLYKEGSENTYFTVGRVSGGGVSTFYPTGFTYAAIEGDFLHVTAATCTLDMLDGAGVQFSTGHDHRFVITDDSGNAGLGFTANAANVNISTVDGEVCRVTSSRRYKQNIKPARIDVQAVLALQPKQFRTKAEVKKLGKDAPVHVGVIAEEAAELGLDAWVEHDKDGPEAFGYANFSIALLAVVQDQQKQIDALKAAVERLSGDR